jgi:hypothetical protein
VRRARDCSTPYSFRATVAGIAVLEQRLADAEMPGVAKARDPLQLVGSQIREHRIHFQDDRKFGRFGHCNAFWNQNNESGNSLPGTVS